MIIGAVLALALTVMPFVIYIACHWQEDCSEEAIADFAPFSCSEEVALVIDEIVMFENRIVDLEKLAKGENEFFANGYVLYDGKIIYSTTGEKDDGHFVAFYECDLFGNNKTLVFEKKLKTNAETLINGEMAYIKHYSSEWKVSKNKIIDSYNIKTGEYKTVSEGDNGIILSDFATWNTPDDNYCVEKKDGDTKYFEITNKKTQEKKLVDSAFLENTKYAQVIKKWRAEAMRYDISNGRILLTYSISAGSMHVPHLIFVYDFENHEIKYGSLVFPYDTTPVEIFYCG